MRFSFRHFAFLTAIFFFAASYFGAGCGQIGAATGGPKDTLAPKLIRANPAYGSRNVSSNKVTLEFNEYIEVADLQENLIISPVQSKAPSIIINNKSIAVKFRDSLLPNTTYTLNFGKAVKDLNEGNVYENLSYTFSTGPALDSLTLAGNVLLAETGGADSAMIVMLYRKATDSSVKKIKPNYITKVSSDGSFSFDHLPADSFRIYALKDGDGSKTYNSGTEIFAFADKAVQTGKNEDILLYAFAKEKKTENKPSSPTTRKTADKKLRYEAQGIPLKDILSPLDIVFNNPLKVADSNKIYLADTFYQRIKAVSFSMDSTSKKITLGTKWVPDMPYMLIIQKDAVKDSSGNMLAKTDTVRFTTQKTESYGKLTLRFTNLDLKKNPVLEILNGDAIKYAYPLSSAEWTNSLFPPGEYGIRILYDTDKNGVWTPGDYDKKLQPELTVTLPQKLAVKADWENERDINL